MDIFTWLFLAIAFYAGTYVPKEARQKAEKFIAAMFTPKPKSKPIATPEVKVGN